jgi:predicted alpha/beta superfamily hydrolase
MFIVMPAWANWPAVTIIVNAPASTPAGAQLYIAGGHPSLGNWNPGEVGLVNESGSRWMFRETYEQGTVLEFKITLGSWERQATYGGPGVPGNTVATISADTTIVLSPAGWSAPAVRASGGGITGTVKYHRGLQGKGLTHKRDLIVWLPPSYGSDPSRRYPVLYMHDGQNIIDPSTSFIGAEWRADEVADSLIRAGSVEEFIIVGINNSPDRVPEYSDTPLGRAYAAFVVETVKPMIDSLYRTKADRNNTAVVGSSMGGLVSFLFAWEHGDVFSKAGCLSPAFLVDSNKVLRQLKAYRGAKKDLRIYLDVGGVGLETRLKPGYDEMIGLLEGMGYAKGRDLEYFCDPSAEHTEAGWANRLWRPLLFMFGKTH